MRNRSAPEPLDLRTTQLIGWALAGQPEDEPLPHGAHEILAAQRRADLFATWEGVYDFGNPAAELFRAAYGLPEVLIRKPEGIVTQVGPYYLADGIAEMLVHEHEWAELQWPTSHSLRRYLFRHARRVLWKRMRVEDRNNLRIIRSALDAYPKKLLHRERRELLLDVAKSFDPVKRMMPELDRYCRTLANAADNERATVDRTIVARSYGIPEDRVHGLLAMIERKYKPELDRLLLELGLYVRRRRVRVDAQSGKFQIKPDDAV